MTPVMMKIHLLGLSDDW